MLLLVNVQNGFMEKCDSKKLRCIVDAAELMHPARVIRWSNPPVEALGKKIDASTNSEYALAVYPEINKLSLPTSSITGLDKLPREFYQEIKSDEEIFLAGCNVDSWIVKIALEMWNVSRKRPKIITDAWFSVGPAGMHGDALAEVTRHFGASTLVPWEPMREELIKARAALAAALSGDKKT
jgi:hypothetical protein